MRRPSLAARSGPKFRAEPGRAPQASLRSAIETGDGRSDQAGGLVERTGGVGKTTVGRSLAARARNGICVHGDDLKRLVVSRDLDTVRSGLSYVGGAALADVYLDAGYDLVVFEFVFSEGRHVERFLGALRSDVAVHLVTLWAPLATVMAREAVRSNRERLGARVAESWGQLAAHLDELGVLIDARHPVDGVVRSAHRKVEEGAALLSGGAG